MRKGFWGMILLGVLCFGMAVPADARARAYSLQEFEGELRQAVELGDHNALTAVMRRYGWVPMKLHLDKSEGGTMDAVGIATAEPNDLTLRMYAFRNDRRPREFAVYGEYTWSDHEQFSRRGSYDVMGIDWNNNSLTSIGINVSNENILWYRGEDPYQRSVTFNMHDPQQSAYKSGTGWVVLEVPTGFQNGTKLQFNQKFEHTYMTVNTSHTWSASLEWDSQLKGNTSYTLQLTTSETKWSKGKFYSCSWPCG